MPARTGSTTYVPGRGATTVREKKTPKGYVQKKTFTGNRSAAPTGTTVVEAPSAAEATVEEVTPGGERRIPVDVRGKARGRQLAAAERREERVRKIARRSRVESASKQKTRPVTVQTHKRSAPGPTKQKTVTVKPHTRNQPATAPKYVSNEDFIPTGPTPRIRRAERDNHATFLREQGGVQKAPQQRELKGTQQQRQKVRVRLQRTKKALAGAEPELIGDLGPEQKKFIMGVAKKTHLSPLTIAAQARAEEGNASQTEAEGTHNFLNMGPGIRYSSLQEGIDATAANYNDTSNPNYAGVRATRGMGPEAQVKAIVASPWGTTDLIEKTLGDVSLKRGNQKAVANYKAAVEEAKELGMKVAPTGLHVGKPPVKKVKAMRVAEKAMKEIEGTPYVWGGGHAAFTSEYGLDCSGAVSYVLHSIMPNRMKAPLTSSEMGAVLKPGPGALTVYYNPEHTFLSYVNKKGETIYWGTSAGYNGAGGLGPHPTPSDEYLSQYEVGHVPGMDRKLAIQLGAMPGSFQGVVSGGSSTSVSAPGISFSDNGTTATIEQGKGIQKKGKPGPSKQPIELSLAQVREQRRSKFQRLGAEYPGAQKLQPAGNTLDDELAALEEKYAIGAV